VEETSEVIMSTQITAELLEENERLRTRLKGFKQREISSQKFSDFITTLIFAGIYLVCVYVIMSYAELGVVYSISGATSMEESIIMGIYLTANIFLYLIGIIGALWISFDIYDEEVTNFIYKHASRTVQNIEANEEDEEFDFLDEEIVKHIEEEIKKDLDSGYVARRLTPKVPQPRDANGRFASTKVSK
jgi:hypothetical protein